MMPSSSSSSNQISNKLFLTILIQLRMKTKLFNASFISESKIYANQISTNIFVEKQLLKLRYIIIFKTIAYLVNNEFSR